MPFQFVPVDEIPGLVLVEPRRFEDDRGWFMETFKASDFADHGIASTFLQDNHSRSTRRGVLRGLHYQNPPSAQGKLVRCTRGEVFDVAVDIRVDSPTFGQWEGRNLSEDNGRMLWIPPGFAHGFCTLTEVADLVYKVTAEYSPDDEAAIRWDDPTVGIDWPVDDPVVSDKDAEAPELDAAEIGFIWAEHGPDAGEAGR